MNEIVTKRSKIEAKTGRTVRFIFSTGAEDMMRDTIDPAGWKLESYKANPVVLWGHDKRTPPIGKASDVHVDSSGRLVGDVTFATAEEFPLAETIYSLVKGGFINAGSVGFSPLKMKWNDARGGIDYFEQELLEYSVVTVPANPEALVIARSAGIDLSPMERVIRETPSNQFDEIRNQLFAQSSACEPAKVSNGRRYRAALASVKSRI